MTITRVRMETAPEIAGRASNFQLRRQTINAPANIKGVNKMSKIEVIKLQKMNTVNALEKISKHESVRRFNESYCTADNLQQRKIDGLGCAIAHYAGWDGLQIMKIFAAALEDANFHGECEKVREWIANEDTRR